jgi:DNA/RNA-binding domain of Phe-tRNA-synthetase-like protein
VSVRTLCSLGAHDLDRIALPVCLRPLTGKETFTPLGSDRPEPVAAGEFGYVDAAGRLLCRLDVHQANFSKVTQATVNALVIVEGTTAHAPVGIRRAFAEVLEAIPRHCGGTAEVVALPEPTEVSNGDDAAVR